MPIEAEVVNGRYVDPPEVGRHGTIWFVGGIVVAALAGVGLLAFQPGGRMSPPLPSAHVLITTDAGHGSATHIGNGLYVTAAHVAAAAASQAPGLSINGQPATLLWASADYDIALVSGPIAVAAVPLACVVPAVGSAGEAYGNPMEFTDIIMAGRIAGVARPVHGWAQVVPVDVSMAPGMSGGSFMQDGQMVGVNVGVALMPVGFGASAFGLSFIVPAKVVCSLMGRA